MNQDSFIIIMVAVVGTVVFLSFFFSKKAVVKRKLKRAVVRRISDVRSSETAKIIGAVELADQPLIAPLSKRECAYYSVLVEQKVQSGKSSHWRTLIDEHDSVPFVINDGTGVACIKGDNIKSYIVPDAQYRSGWHNDANTHLESYLNRHGFESHGFMGMNKTIRYREGVLEDGEKVALLGRGDWTTASEMHLPDKYERVLLIHSIDGQSVYISDDTDTTTNEETPRYNKNYRR